MLQLGIRLLFHNSERKARFRREEYLTVFLADFGFSAFYNIYKKQKAFSAFYNIYKKQKALIARISSMLKAKAKAEAGSESD